MIELASVAMKAFTRADRDEEAVAEAEPEPRRALRGSSRARPGRPSPTKAFAAMTAEKAAIAPTERSNPPAMKTSAPPQAMIPIGCGLEREVDHVVPGQEDVARDRESVMKSAMKATTIP